MVVGAVRVNRVTHPVGRLLGNASVEDRTVGDHGRGDLGAETSEGSGDEQEHGPGAPAGGGESRSPLAQCRAGGRRPWSGQLQGQGWFWGEGRSEAEAVSVADTKCS